MRIIVNAISANTGGIVTYTTNLIEYVAARDVEVIVYVPRWFDTSQFAGLNVRVETVKTRFFGPVHRFLWEQFRWRKIVKKSGADIVFSSANYGILFPPVPQVLLVQGEIYLNPVYRKLVLPRLSWRERLSALLRRNLMLVSARHSRTTIFPSQVALDAALDFDPQLAENSVVNYLGVSPRFDEPARRRQWRQDGTIRLLYVSVYYPHKDPTTLAEATLDLRGRGVPVKTHITMEAHDFEAWDTAQAEFDLLHDPKYGDCLEMGRIEHDALGDVLATYDAFVFPSMAETFGFPMVEAMRAGVPLVVSDIPVHREICGDAAIYFKLGVAEDLADKILLLNDNAELRDRLVKAGRQRAESQFTWAQHVDKLVAEFQSVTDPSRFRLMINALHARSGGGVTYLHNMLPLLAADERLDIHVCLHEDQRDVLPTGLSGIRYHYQKYKRGFWRVLFREQIDLPRLARRLNMHATFSPANYGPFLSKNHVILIRNAVSVGFVERRPMKLAYWALLYLATLTSLFNCRRAIAVSNYAKRGIEGAFSGFLSKRLVVVPHGVDPTYASPPASHKRDSYLLSVSDIYVQKNFVGLINVIARLRHEFPDIHLKVAGSPVDEEYFNSLKALIRKEKLENHVEFLGHVTPASLKGLYENCRVFVFPSTVETFGNPLVEAMACGAPIASSQSAAMPEVLGDAAEFFDPNSIDDMCAVVTKLLKSPDRRLDLSARAIERAKSYSWNETKRRTIEVIRGDETHVPN